MFRFYGLLLLGAFFVFCVAIVIGSLFKEKKRHQRIQSAFEAEYGDRTNDCTAEVKGLVALYLNMVAKHGPDSEEAKAFRFGTDSSLMQRLHGDDDALRAFHDQADTIDEVCRRVTQKGRSNRSERTV